MTLNKSELQARLAIDQFPRAGKYDPQWVLDNFMGPNVIWLSEALSQVMSLEPGTRVLDMGCGRAISSIFLAKEFDLQVWATDLWISASENWERIRQAGMSERVFPVHAEARSLPYADGFFDAILSMDAYHYFGTDDLYLGYYFARLVKPGGQIGIIMPGLIQEFDAGLPVHLQPYWEWEFASFHSPAWWQKHWERSGQVKVERADSLPDGWRHWLLWLEVCAEAGARTDEREAEMLRVDAGRNLGFTRLVARRIVQE